MIGWALGLAASTVHAVLRRHGCSRLVERPALRRSCATSAARPASSSTSTSRSSAASSARPPRHRRPLAAQAKGKAGWQYLYVAIDDYSRLGFAAVYPDETADSALAFLDELVRFYGAHGIRVERVLTDNGTCFKRRWAEACDRPRSP